MKILVQHDFPRKVRYARVYFELGTASMYLTLDGSSASWYGSIGGKKKLAFVSDKEYSRYRNENPATEVIDSDSNRVIVKNSRGYEEEWLGPRWVLAGIRKTRERKRLG
ncbi:MAG: hypothetical protein OK422_03740 [Thaumarchaeota archaeon]|nr:hypothetical protein [Nitrososphaerota archaeon]